MKQVLIAVDGSPASDEAVDVGLDLAGAEGAAVTFVHVAPTVQLAVGSYLTVSVPVPVEELSAADEDAVLVRAAACAAEQGVEAKVVEQYGVPAEAIAAVADTVAADVIVIGSRGLGALGRAVLGSTSRKLLSQTGRPVLVVRAAKAPVPA